MKGTGKWRKLLDLSIWMHLLSMQNCWHRSLWNRTNAQYSHSSIRGRYSVSSPLCACCYVQYECVLIHMKFRILNFPFVLQAISCPIGWIPLNNIESLQKYILFLLSRWNGKPQSENHGLASCSRSMISHHDCMCIDTHTCPHIHSVHIQRYTYIFTFFGGKIIIKKTQTNHRVAQTVHLCLTNLLQENSGRCNRSYFASLRTVLCIDKMPYIYNDQNRAKGKPT